MAKASIALSELVEKGAKDDIVRELLGHVAERLMEFEIEQRCGAEYGERSADRSNSRNGYRDRLWETRAGAIELRIPKLRKGSYLPALLEPRRTAEKALVAVVASRGSPSAARVRRSTAASTRSARTRCAAGCWPRVDSSCIVVTIESTDVSGKETASIGSLRL